jgi:hypothetical protein
MFLLKLLFVVGARIRFRDLVKFLTPNTSSEWDSTVSRRRVVLIQVRVRSAVLERIDGIKTRNKSTRTIILTLIVVVALKVLTGTSTVFRNTVEAFDCRTIVTFPVGKLAVVLGNVAEETVGIGKRVLGLPEVVVTVFCIRFIFVEIALAVRESGEVEIDSDKTTRGASIFAPEDEIARVIRRYGRNIVDKDLGVAELICGPLLALISSVVDGVNRCSFLNNDNDGSLIAIFPHEGSLEDFMPLNTTIMSDESVALLVRAKIRSDVTYSHHQTNGRW